VLGVVTSKFPKLEDQKEMVERVYKAADYVAEGSGQSREEALQRLCVSPQCGFASHAEGNPLGYEVRNPHRYWVAVSSTDRSMLVGHEEEAAAGAQHRGRGVAWSIVGGCLRSCRASDTQCFNSGGEEPKRGYQKWFLGCVKFNLVGYSVELQAAQLHSWDNACLEAPLPMVFGSRSYRRHRPLRRMLNGAIAATLPPKRRPRVRFRR